MSRIRFTLTYIAEYMPQFSFSDFSAFSIFSAFLVPFTLLGSHSWFLCALANHKPAYFCIQAQACKQCLPAGERVKGLGFSEIGLDCLVCLRYERVTQAKPTPFTSENSVLSSKGLRKGLSGRVSVFSRAGRIISREGAKARSREV